MGIKKNLSDLSAVQVQSYEISPGVSLEASRKRAQEIFETVVKLEVEEEKKLTSRQKKIVLSSEQKIYANCLSPY